MTRYETIVNLGDELIKLMGKSLIPIHVLDWKVYYEAYLKEMESERKHFTKVRKTRAMSNVADNYKITDRTMRNIVAFMEGA